MLLYLYTFGLNLPDLICLYCSTRTTKTVVTKVRWTQDLVWTLWSRICQRVCQSQAYPSPPHQFLSGTMRLVNGCNRYLILQISTFTMMVPLSSSTPSDLLRSRRSMDTARATGLRWGRSGGGWIGFTWRHQLILLWRWVTFEMLMLYLIYLEVLCSEFLTNTKICFWQTNRFGICLAVRITANCSPSTFAFQPIPALDRHGVDVARDDILQNYMGKDDQLMNDRKPWRGPREKSTMFMQMLIEASSLPGNVVLDCTAATG